MPMNISSVGLSSVPPEPLATATSQPSGPASPSPQDLQATINQGIQQAAQSLDQIMGAVTGNTSGANPQGNTTILDTNSSQSSSSDVAKKDVDTQQTLASKVS